MDLDRAALWTQAANHHGVLTRGDLRAAGVSAGQRQRLVASGLLVAIGQRSYRMAGAPRTDLQIAAAAVLDTAGSLSHRSGCWLHEVGRFGVGAQPEVMVAGGRSRYRGDLARVHATTWLPPDDLVVVRGIRVTSVARTLFSMAAIESEVGHDVVRGLVDDAVRQGKASDKWLWWRLEKLRCRGRNGVRAFEAILVDRAGGKVTESWLEREFLAILEARGIPLPVCQRRVARRGAFVARVDFSYADAGLVIEVLGHTFHASRAQLAEDAARRNKLQIQGLRVIEFVYDDVVGRPDEVAATVVRALHRSAPRSGR